MSRLFAFVGVCSFVCLASIGCGGGGADLGQVSGTVTMDGAPLANALVTFVPADGGRSASGKTDASGEYQLAFGADGGALIGQHEVTITTVNVVEGNAEAEAVASSDSDAYMQQATGGSASDYDNAEMEEKIPAKYNTESTLTAEVKAGENVIDFPLTSEDGAATE